MKSTLKIKVEDITKSKSECIVNAANERLLPGGGVCGAIFRRAGYEKLDKACREIGFCETGDAVITPGFDLEAKYIIHTVGPVWRGGEHGERELLYSCYKKSLELCIKTGIGCISFPLISSGIYGYPAEDAWEVAIESISDFLENHADCKIDVTVSVLDESMAALGRAVLERR